MGKAKDLTGQRFGRLVAIEATDKRSGGNIIWRCVCDCGTILEASTSRLVCGHTRSCGCLKKEQSTINGKRAIEVVTRHACTYSRLYRVWNAMKNRCHNPNDKSYKNYGGRGIIVCDEWRDDFVVFRDWALKNGYDEKAPRGESTIDRIDNDRGYSPENCRFVDMKIQGNNRRNRKK